jgi:hypothetical protein
LFQLDGESKVENITKWIFHHVLTIDWIIFEQICNNLCTKLSKIQSVKVRPIFMPTRENDCNGCFCSRKLKLICNSNYFCHSIIISQIASILNILSYLNFVYDTE